MKRTSQLGQVKPDSTCTWYRTNELMYRCLNRSPFIFFGTKHPTIPRPMLHFTDHKWQKIAFWGLYDLFAWSLQIVGEFCFLWMECCYFCMCKSFLWIPVRIPVGKQRTSVWQNGFAVYSNQLFYHSVSERMMLFFCGFGCSDSICVVYMVSAVCLAFRFVSTDISSSFVLLQLFLCLSVYI